jgi:hypothetical protein
MLAKCITLAVCNMLPINETEEERKKRIESSESYQSYSKGWMDAAGLKSMRKEFEGHDKAHIRENYSKGYTDGYNARKRALKRAEKLFGYKPRIIRACSATAIREKLGWESVSEEESDDNLDQNLEFFVDG